MCLNDEMKKLSRTEDIAISVLVFTVCGFAVCLFILFTGIIAAVWG